MIAATPEPDTMTASQVVIAEWVRWKIDHKPQSRQTAHSYRLHMEAFLRMHGPDLWWGRATADQFRAYINMPTVYSARGRGVPASPGTKKQRFYALMALMRWLHSSGRIKSNPMVEMERYEQDETESTPVAPSDWAKVWSLAMSGEMRDCDIAALGLMRFCGLRIGEVRILRPEAFGTIEGDPMLHGFTRKGGKPARYPVPWVHLAVLYSQQLPGQIGGEDGHAVFVGAVLRTIEAMKDRPYLMCQWADEKRDAGRKPKYRQPEGYVTKDCAAARYRKAVRPVGLDQTTHPHMLRHAFGTDAVQGWEGQRSLGLSLLETSRIMGHRDTTITEKYIRAKTNPVADLLASLQGRQRSQVSLDDYGPWGG